MAVINNKVCLATLQGSIVLAREMNIILRPYNVIAQDPELLPDLLTVMPKAVLADWSNIDPNKLITGDGVMAPFYSGKLHINFNMMAVNEIGIELYKKGTIPKSLRRFVN